MDRPKPIIALTLGDPNGIGPEVLLKCLLDKDLAGRMQPVVVGDAAVLRTYRRQLKLPELPIHAFSSWPEALPEAGVSVLEVASGQDVEVRPGELTEAAGRLSMLAVEAATGLCFSGRAEAMVTAPLSKEAIRKAGYSNPGHTEYIAQRTQANHYAMVMVAGALRVGLVTGHVALRDVAAGVTQEAILSKLRVLHESLQQDFGIEAPSIAVLGLNPHAGDGGLLGKEEKEVITPAVEAFNKAEGGASGPFPADGFFGLRSDRGFDAVLAMYHDQGLVPFKALSFEQGVNFTAGLPIVRTSPDHGTAFDIAGRGEASYESMRRAIELAIEVATRRSRQSACEEPS